ncbi:UNVERIFIED_CONTAM: hypothetical protein PYX00_001629 [Menopon gallinae]|uniref:Uncharacterized protein n=1 Tax=Menopon gallinae TaxID=328185 RepID=A0AAW2IEQ8_9NEOP
MDSENKFANVERVTPGRQRVPGGTNAFRVIDKPSTPPKHEHGTWVSPSNVLRKRSKEDLPRAVREPEPPTSPKRIRSSLHRVLDCPRPVDSRGDWIPMKEVCQTALHIPLQGCEERGHPRSSSQCTYTVRRRSVLPPDEPLPVRKVSVLDDLEPVELRPRKADHVRSGSGDRIRRTVHADGRVVKVSTLDDFAGISKIEERRPEMEEKTESGRRNVLKKMVLRDVGSPRKAKTGKRSVEERDSADKIEKKEEDQNNKENKPRNGKIKGEEEKTNEEVDEVMTELKNILNDRKDEASAKRKTLTERKKPIREEDVAKKAKTEERREVRKRNVDLKAVQKYIKMQKMKRMEQSKMEREKKAVEEEARKKKLEELRIRTLQLAATSKKKAQEPAQVISTIKVVEPEAEAEEEMTVSLGLKQTKPKVSYNESISNLRRRPASAPKLGQKQQETPIIVEEPQKPAEEDAIHLSPECLSAKLEAPKTDMETNANLTLKKLAETLQMTMEQQKRASNPPFSPRKAVSHGELSTRESASGRKLVTVDVETIKSLKQDIKKISENFQVLHEIITDKSTANQPAVSPEPILMSKVSHLSLTANVKPQITADTYSGWLRNTMIRPHPYNVLSAIRSKMKLNQHTCSEASERSVCSEPVSKSESETESVAASENRYSLCRTDDVTSTDAKTGRSSTEDNYYSLREDSGSELSSSILDSDKERILSKRESLTKPQDCLKVDNAVRNTPQSSVAEEVASVASLDSVSVRSKRTSSSRESLVPPDVQLDVRTKISSERSDASSFCRHTKVESTSTAITDQQLEEFESRSDVVITELDELVTESKSSSAKVESAVAKVAATRSAFNPEAIHMQFQAELTLLETFQRSLAHFLEVEKVKALSQTNIRTDKAVNTEFSPDDQSVKSAIEEDESTESVKTELDVVKVQDEVEESIKTETEANDQKSTATEAVSEQKSASSSFRKKASDKNDLSDGTMGISFQMLNRMMKDEELRSEHQLALIRLREKTLNEKVKAELTLLEMRKKALKGRGSSEELAISAIKKKQRGILLKYQNEREDIERLKKMHRIASEERKIMIKQQKQIRKMQLTTKDMLIKLKKRENSPQKRSPVRAKGSKFHDSPSEIQEEISINMSENTVTETITSVEESIEHSIDSDLDITSRSNISEGDDEILRRNMKTLKEKVSKSVDKLTVPKKQMVPTERKHLKRGPSVDELLKWTKRLEEKENWLKEMEKEAENLFTGAKHRSPKFLKDAKTVRDRSTSPFQFQEVVKSICESSPSITEAIEAKKSSLAELIESKTQGGESSRGKTSESVPEKVPISTSEDIPEEFSKKVSSRLEYNSESFESPSSSDTHKSKTVPMKSNDSEQNAGGNGITIKMALSPRVHSARRRYSSGSDDSINLFHTETASEQSDVEIRIAALHEQLRKRKLEAERLRREQKKAHRERLKAKEQSLLKQIEAYDTYIQKKKQELEREYERSPQTVSKPVMKQSKAKRPETVNEDEGNTSLQAKFALRNVIESDSEVSESIKEEDSAAKEGADSTIVSEIISKNKDSPCSTTSSMLESLPKQTVASDGSHSESEEQTVSNVSVKTTLLSPERPELEASAKADTVENEDIETVPSESIVEENYSQDSFESEEKSNAREEEVSEERKTSDVVEETECVEEEEDAGVAVAETPEPEDVTSETKDEDETPEVASEAPAEVEDNSRIVALITESVLNDLMNESVELFRRKSERTAEEVVESEDEVRAADVEDGLELLTSMLVADLVSEAIDDSIRMYNKKKMVQEERILDVRRRVHEIMSQTPGTRREQRRPQDMMVTTYDVTAAQDEEVLNSPEREEFLQSLSAKQGKPLKVEVNGSESTPQAATVEAYGQEWFDDDFGLSRSRREAEELRVQQLQIEQEIQQLQAQQEQVLYYYLRQIPNKPPPPYTPPGTTTAERLTSEAEITAVMSAAVRFLTDEMNAGKDVGDVQPPGVFFGANDSEHVKCYKVFLFDLAKHIISEVIGVEFQEDRLPWMRTNVKLSKFKMKRAEKTYECLFDVVMKQVLVLFGFQQKMGKERLIVRWSRKKRDHVDELLVGESQEEEAEWTQYDEDEVTVKNNVTVGILDSLLDETAQLLNAIWTKKVKVPV